MSVWLCNMAVVGGELRCLTIVESRSQVIVHRHGTRFPTKPSGALDGFADVTCGQFRYDL